MILSACSSSSYQKVFDGLGVSGQDSIIQMENKALISTYVIVVGNILDHLREEDNTICDETTAFF